MYSKLFLVMTTLFCLCACAKKDSAYFLERGEEVKQQLITELEGVDSLHDLFARQEELTALFDELARLATEARRYQLKTKESWEISPEASSSSQALAQEMRRVLELPGARAFLEKCQGKGLERLDAFERNARQYPA